MEKAKETMSGDTALAIVIPVMDDWRSAGLLLDKLDAVLVSPNLEVEVFVVDDGSTLSFDQADFSPTGLANIDSVSVIELKRNMGHQRAITIGLSFVAAERKEFDAVVVMDGDGEDNPSDVVKLLDRCREEEFSKMIFARRSKRSEGVLFRFFYYLFVRFFRLFTGQTIRIGNFSIVPRRILERLVVVSEVWNHYAVGTIKARVPFLEIETERGRRLVGVSKMNFVSLVKHGLSAISVYGDIVGVRLLLGTCMLIVLSVVGVVIVVGIRIFTDLAIPGWATNVIALLLIFLMQAVTLSLFFIFLILNNRNNSDFLPERDCKLFIAEIHEVFTK